MAFSRVVVLTIALIGCATVVPMQTASTVPEGGYRIGGSIALSPLCVGRACYVSGLPAPEIRAAARHGVGQGVDLGLSAQLAGTLGSVTRTALFVDGKVELASRPIDGEGARRQILSIGPGVGFTNLQRRFPDGVVELALPLYAGHQTERVEWVLALRPLGRVVWRGQFGQPRRPGLETEAGLSLAAFGRGRVRFGAELGYQADPFQPQHGVFTLALGVFTDVSPLVD